jgi:hypothetical protein
MSLDNLNGRLRVLERIQFVTTRQKARVAERAKLDEAMKRLADADREDEAELARLLKELSGAEVSASSASATAPKPEAEVATDLGVQDIMIALMHRYEGQSFDVQYAMTALYPNDEHAKAYKKIYGTLDAMKTAKKAQKVDGGKARWKPLRPRDPRAIRLPNGDILEAATKPS